MRNIIIRILPILTAAALLAGCTSPIEPDDPGSLPYLSVGTQSITVDGSDQTETIRLLTNRTPSFDCDARWLTVTYNSTAGSVTLNIEQNTSYESRTASVTISISDGMISETLSVIQSASGTPHISGPRVLSFTDTELTLAADILSQGTDAVTSAGFLIGTVRESLSQTAGTIEGQSFSAIIGSLTPSTVYYIAAYAANSAGLSYTDTVTAYTGGLPVLKDQVDDVTPGYSEMTITATMEFPGTLTTTYGTILSTEPELDIDNALSIQTHRYESTEAGSITWTDTHSGLNQGRSYYYRTYATNEYGTVYGEVEQAFTYGTPDLPTYFVNVDPVLTPYEGLPDNYNPLYRTDISNLYHSYYRDDITGSGEWESTYYDSSDTTYRFQEYEGCQTLIFTNTDPGTYFLEGVENEDELLRYTLKDGYSMSGIIYAVEDMDLRQETDISPEFRYLTSYIDVEMTYTDASGNKVSDLSSVLLPDASLTIGGLSSDCAVLTDGSCFYEGEVEHYVSYYDTGNTDTRSLGGTAVFPSNGRSITITVTLNLTDGSTKTLTCGYGSIKPGRYYRILLNVLEVSYENGTDFELDVMEDYDENIDIDF